MVFLDFSRLESPEIDEKSMPKRIRKKHRKKLSKNRFWRPRLAPKTSENRSKITKNRSAKRCRTKPVSRRYANHPGLGGSQRKSSFVISKRRASVVCTHKFWGCLVPEPHIHRWINVCGLSCLWPFWLKPFVF